MPGTKTGLFTDGGKGSEGSKSPPHSKDTFSRACQYMG